MFRGLECEEMLRTVLEVLSGRAPFAALKYVRELVKEGILRERPQNCWDIDNDLWDVMKPG